MKWICFFLFFIVLPVNAAKHPVHLSVISMELDNENLQLNYTIRILQEDYVYLIGLIYDAELHKNNSGATVNFDSTLINKYFYNAFTILADGNALSSEVIGSKNDIDNAWLSFRIKLGAIPENLTIQNKIMLDVFLDQTNLVIFSYMNKEKGLTFDAQNTKQLISLKNIY